MKFKEFLKEDTVDHLVQRIKEKYSAITIKQNKNDLQSFGWDEADHKNDKLKPYPRRKHHVFDDETGEVFQTLEGLFGEDGKWNPDYEHVWSFKVKAKSHVKVSLGEDFPGFIRANHVEVGRDNSGPRPIIDGFTGWPKTNNLALLHCDIKSLADIEKLNVEDVEIELIEQDDLQCGVLRLLKCPHLIRVDIGAISGSMDDHDEFDEMVQIVDKHLPEKDVAECMDELIEAGFKKYAKM